MGGGLKTNVPQVNYLPTNNGTQQKQQSIINPNHSVNVTEQGFLGVLGNIFGVGQKRTGEDTRVYAKDILTDYNTVDEQNRATWLKEALGDDYRVNNGVLQKSYTDENGVTQYQDLKDDAVVAGDSGLSTTWNAGQFLGNMQNLLNIGNSGWGLYANVQNYKQNKELASKQKDLLDQQIKYNQENMDYVREERKRQDTMRSNVSAQRSSTSNVRNF